MRIQFGESDIETAMQDYIKKQGIVTEGKTVNLHFVMGRKNRGLSAEAEITDAKPSVVALEKVTEESPSEESSEVQVNENGSLFNN